MADGCCCPHHRTAHDGPRLWLVLATAVAMGVVMYQLDVATLHAFLTAAVCAPPALLVTVWLVRLVVGEWQLNRAASRPSSTPDWPSPVYRRAVPRALPPARVRLAIEAAPMAVDVWRTRREVER